jgi:peptide chain release factor 1
MIEKLTSIKHRFEEIEQLIVQPDAMSDMKMYAKLNQEYRSLEKIVIKADAYLLALENLKNTKDLLSIEKDEEFRTLAKAEIDALEQQI